jgi:hypothetical protein
VPIGLVIRDPFLLQALPEPQLWLSQNPNSASYLDQLASQKLADFHAGVPILALQSKQMLHLAQ